ncbi:MAG: hypothetical protein BWY49_00471 [Candidatus Omnitrophica bacterium ADurb.Bin314]|nr:MAG: hypothetical protein BWY49_00471 [Candidatus Omnitrophica bacterium ADurb.Bin314]
MVDPAGAHGKGQKIQHIELVFRHLFARLVKKTLKRGKDLAGGDEFVSVQMALLIDQPGHRPDLIVRHAKADFFPERLPEDGFDLADIGDLSRFEFQFGADNPDHQQGQANHHQLVPVVTDLPEHVADPREREIRGFPQPLQEFHAVQGLDMHRRVTAVPREIIPHDPVERKELLQKTEPVKTPHRITDIALETEELPERAPHPGTVDLDRIHNGDHLAKQPVQRKGDPDLAAPAVRARMFKNSDHGVGMPGEEIKRIFFVGGRDVELLHLAVNKTKLPFKNHPQALPDLQ